MRLILHVGTAKTGTTSLQRSLCDSRKILEEYGVLYPSTFKKEVAHHLLLGLYRSSDRGVIVRLASGSHNIKKAANSLWEKIKREIDRKKPKVTILSSEYLFHGNVENFQKLRSRLGEVSDDIHPCVYIREPVSWYVSSLQQGTKTKGRIPQPEAKDIRSRIEAIENAFRRKIHLRPFEHQQLYQQDIVADFEQSYLRECVPPKTVLTNRYNESISAEAMAILSRYRRFALADVESFPMASASKLRRLISEYESEKRRYNKPVLKSHVGDFLRNISIDYLWLKEKYAVEFDALDYSKINSNHNTVSQKYSKIEDVIEVDEEWRDEIMFHILHEKLIAPESKWTTVSNWQRKKSHLKGMLNKLIT